LENCYILGTAQHLNLPLRHPPAQKGDCVADRALAGGGICKVWVRFAPTASGAQCAKLTAAGADTPSAALDLMDGSHLWFLGASPNKFGVATTAGFVTEFDASIAVAADANAW
jgi:hypothetical protein